ncbi:unnamed protein product [Tilletia controversa]|uniref:Steroid 5-alpha reductase C-terminal domain-containing protein n=2 Tax=Tilletia TaxID=13289 RepID=A0A8X7MVP6_9BASI|nr:hypothetical protein CF336_g3100 [Tilletia laevis]KAE8251034.1 hypothetical protein A4X06_0g2839 [Tilletia controversa]KAE8205708.1 hypothetical protein CF335_g2214 [Tilletia laevis]CAD6919930.1 unnamed protein product [Tilletia laevis]CAD6920133.1 unnamed protein product [Tilletia controversa]
MVFLAGLRTAVGPTIGLIFGVQAIGAAHAIVTKSERYYDLFGSVGFLTASVFSLYAPFLTSKVNTGILTKGSLAAFPPAFSSLHPRQLLMTSLTVIWAARLGSFLFSRIQKTDGKDSRFDDLRESPVKFAGAWAAQATWITLTALPLYMVNAIPAAAQPALGARDAIGLGLWLAAFLMEVVADNQKGAWRKEKDEGKHQEAFISRGLWSLSRHPNMFGEIGLHTAEFVLATTALASAAPFFSPGPAIAAAALGPISEALLIRYVSGVSMQEEANDKKFKDDPKWKAYKDRTPVLIPFLGSTKA